MMRLETQCEPGFARHETFFPRYGWFKKAVDAATRDPEAFARDEATISLGVGKNMVRAIKFWGLAAKVIEPVRSKRNHVVPTAFGRAVFGDEETSWDPFLEDPATLWLLHWHLLAPPCHVPVWWSVFNDFTAMEFGEQDLMKFLVSEFSHVSGWKPPQTSSVKKDVACLLRMYVSRGGERAVDDLVDSPFRQMGIVDRVPGDERMYRFGASAKPTLPPEVVTATALEFLSWDRSVERTAVLARLATAPAGPCRVFKISEDDLAKAIEAVCKRWPDRLSISAPAGAPQMTFKEDPGPLASALLLAYYRTRQPRADILHGRGEAESERPYPTLPFGGGGAAEVRELAAGYGVHEPRQRSKTLKGKRPWSRGRGATSER
jgi:hypothetical protein